MLKIHRPATPPDIPTPHIIYPSSLALLGQGYALWYPEPHITGEPQIGDVGYVGEGSFIRLFNLNIERKEHQVTFWDPLFTIAPPLPVNVFRVDPRHGSLGPGRFRSHGVQEREMRGSISTAALADAAAALSAGYTCKEVQGALLVLQSRVSSERVFESRRLKRYMVLQHEHWCSYVRDVLGHDVSPQEIVLISGWGKASADWAATVFSNTSTKRYASLRGQFGKLVGLELFGSRTRVQSGPKVHRQGDIYPRPRGTPPDDLKKDQCMFVKRYKLKRRFKILHKIVAGAGYDRLPGNSGEGGSGTGVIADDSGSDEDDPDDGELPPFYKVLDPLDVLLEFILEVCDADCAIARDEDVQSIVGNDSWPVDFATYLRQAQPPVEIEDGYATVSVAALVDRERDILERRHITSLDLRNWPNLAHKNSADFERGRANLPSGIPNHARVHSKWARLSFGDPSLKKDTVHCCALSRDGNLLAASWRSSSIMVWRTVDGLRVQCLGDEIFDGNTSAPISGATTALAFSSDGTRLVSGYADASVIVWHLRSGKPLLRLDGHDRCVNDVTFSPDGSRIFTVSDDGSVKVWDAKSGWPICTFALGSRVKRIVFSASGCRLAAILHDEVAIYDAGPLIVQLTVFKTNSGALRDVVISPDGERTLICDNNGIATIYRIDPWEELLQLQGHSDQIRSVTFSPDGIEVVSGSYDGTLVGQSPETGDIYRKESIGSCGDAVAYSPNGAFLAAAGRNGDVVVWSAVSGEFIVSFETGVPHLAGLKWLPDSRRLLSYAAQGPLHLWSVGDVLRVHLEAEE